MSFKKLAPELHQMIASNLSIPSRKNLALASKYHEKVDYTLGKDVNIWKVLERFYVEIDFDKLVYNASRLLQIPFKDFVRVFDIDEFEEFILKNEDELSDWELFDTEEALETVLLTLVGTLKAYRSVNGAKIIKYIVEQGKKHTKYEWDYEKEFKSAINKSDSFYDEVFRDYFPDDIMQIFDSSQDGGRRRRSSRGWERSKSQSKRKRSSKRRYSKRKSSKRTRH